MRAWPLMLLVVACDPVVGTLVSVPEVFQSGDGERLLELPAIPVDEPQMLNMASLQQWRIGPALVIDEAVNFGIGPSYPDELRLDLERAWVGRCGEFTGRWTHDAAYSSDPSVLDVRIEDGQLVVQLNGEGSATIDVDSTLEGGENVCYPRDTYRVARRWEIRVVEPTDARVERPWDCEDSEESEAFAILAGRPVAGRLYARAYDARGEQIFLHNADTWRQVDTTIALSEGLDAWFEAGAEAQDLSTLVFDGRGQAEIRVNGRRVDTLDVYGVADITAMNAHFAVPWGAGRGDAFLEDGDTYDWSRSASRGRLVVPRVGLPEVDDVLACSVPDPEWFEVSTDPVQEPEPWAERSALFPMNLGVAYTMPDRGEVTLRLTAPDMNQGRGLEHTALVRFVGN